MRPRTLWLLMLSQMLLVALGGWAFLAGGAVWLLVVLMLVVFSAGMRLLVQADLQHSRRALEDELRCQKALAKAQLASPPAGASMEKSEPSISEYQKRIQQLESELRLLCPPSQNSQSGVSMT
jgi:hypothetical protein